MFSIGNNELEGRPRIRKGDSIRCPHCGELHTLDAGRVTSRWDWTLNRSVPVDVESSLLFYKCGTDAYLASLDGALLPGLEPGIDA